MLINAVRFEGDQPQTHQAISADSALSLLRSQDFTWVDLEINDSDNAELYRFLVQELDFHPATVEDCLHPAAFHQPKIDEEQDYKFISLLYYIRNSKTDRLEAFEINIYLSITFAITVHRHPCPELMDSLRRFPRHIAEYQQRAILFCHHVFDTIVDGFSLHLSLMQEKSAELELSVLSSDAPRLRLRLFNRQHRQLSDMRMILRIQQGLVRLRRTLSAELEIIQRLQAEYDYEGASEDSEEIGIYFGDVADHINKYLEIIESHDRTMTHLMEVHHLVTNHRTNEIITILTVLSVIMMPLNLTVGFFGMNFRNLWLIDNPLGQVFVSLSMIAVIIAMLYLFRRKGWI